MSRKLRALGLGLVAALAMSAVAVGSASAKDGGHFTSEVDHTILKGEDVGAGTVFTSFGSEVSCDSTYHGTTEEKTVTEVTITPTYENCVHSLGPATVNMNSCNYLFTVRGDEPDVKHNTVHLTCPGGGPVITVNGPFGACKVEVSPNQTPGDGLVYETGGSGSTHDITAKVTATNIHAVRTEGGFFQCGTFATTDAAAEMNGQATLRGFDTEDNQVGITATGS